MKNCTKKILIRSCLGLFLLAALVIGFFLSVQLMHYPYVATFENDLLMYNGEPYLRIDMQEAQTLIGGEIKLGEVLGEINLDLGLEDYLLRTHPIHAISGDDELNFIAEPMWQSPPAIYCRKEYYDAIGE